MDIVIEYGVLNIAFLEGNAQYSMFDAQYSALKGKIRKVKAVSPSPFYDGKYHPPFIQQQKLLYYNESVTKISKKLCHSAFIQEKLCTVSACLRYVIFLFSP